MCTLYRSVPKSEGKGIRIRSVRVGTDGKRLYRGIRNLDPDLFDHPSQGIRRKRGGSWVSKTRLQSIQQQIHRDVLLSDIGMSGENGYDLIKEIPGSTSGKRR